MSRVLVAEDSPTQAQQIRLMLEDARFEVEVARNGLEALVAVGQQAPDVVLTDLEMPEMNGLELVEAMKRKCPLVPAVLMTAHGSEAIAVEALQRGAASYVPKSRLAEDLIGTIRNVLSLARADRRMQQMLDCLTQTESHFVLDNIPPLLPPLVAHLQETLTLMKLCDENGLIRIGMALSEALVNALYHGNLQLSPDRESGWAYDELAAERRKQRPYCDRRIHVHAKVTRSQIVYVVRDEGPGFDPASLPDPTDPAILEKATGRGLVLIRTFMDDVSFNQAGNEITMVKQCNSAG